MKVTVLYFASIRDITGSASEEVDLPAGASLKVLMDEVVRRHSRVADMRASLMVSVNQEYAEDGSEMSEGDEVALIPPVSGG